MGLRCLIGHEYGDPQTSRDRQQQGSEVVVTVEEYRECVRCGHRRIISENKEVTVEPPATSSSSSSSSSDTPPSVEASWAPPEPSATDEEVSGDETSAGPDEPLTAAEDDGIILEDEPEQPVRAYGEWPTTIRDDEGASDAVGDHDPWPGEPTEADHDPEPGAAATAPVEPADSPSQDDSTSGDFRRTSSADEPVTADQADDPGEPPEPSPALNPRDSELVCPDCGERWPSMNASLRPGDICPDCRRGYLDEHLLQ